MRAKLRRKCHVARLVEAANEIARAQHRLEHRGRIAGVGTDITVAQFASREKRRSAGKIEQDVTARHRAVAGGTEDQPLARRRKWRRIVVDDDLKSTEPALGGT